MLCSKCGAQLAAPTQFCPQCGEPQPAQPVATPKHGAPETDPKAVMSMVLGVLSISILLSVFAGLPAVILGHLSRSSIRRSQGRLKGEGMALAGLIMGYISLFLLPVFVTIVYIAIPNLFRERIVDNEAKTLQILKTINVAAASYQVEHDVYPASLQELNSEGLVELDSQLASKGVQSGYEFSYKPSASQKGYVIHADPEFIYTGHRHFYMDASGVIRSETGQAANASSPSVGP